LGATMTMAMTTTQLWTERQGATQMDRQQPYSY
jgi:hypothetical protein